MHTGCWGRQWAGRAPRLDSLRPHVSSLRQFRKHPKVVIRGPESRRTLVRPLFRAEGTQAVALRARQRFCHSPGDGGLCPLWGHIWGGRPLWHPGCSVTTPFNSRISLISLSVRSLEEIGNGPPACRDLRGDWRGRCRKTLGQERLWYVLRRVRGGGYLSLERL